MYLFANLHRIGNQIEAGVWFVIAAGFLIAAVFHGNNSRRLRCIIAAVALLAFGYSDIVEVSTGAWWSPWWLLAWKAARVGVLSWLWCLTRKDRRLQDGAAADRDGEIADREIADDLSNGTAPPKQ